MRWITGPHLKDIHNVNQIDRAHENKFLFFSTKNTMLYLMNQIDRANTE